MIIEANTQSPMLNRRQAFTLVEMLVAMAITLLMMAAIGRGFAYVGERVKDSRGNLQLSADLSDLTTRLRNELSRCTVSLTPNTGGKDEAGYFMYYEGPLTDATSSLFGVDMDAENPLPHSRYGDLDDYLAFTAVAPPGSWFTGKVPRYLLDQRAVGAGYTLPAGPYDEDPATAAPPNPFLPVVIRSKYAEIVYFASPEYDNSTLPNSPTYVDADGNGLPDRVRLHRRVLLIRPDLNVDFAFAGRTITDVPMLPIQTTGTVPFMQADAWPAATSATVRTTAAGAYQIPTLSDGWLYGLAGVHQQCDLSIRRVLNSDGSHSVNVAANSLDDLSKPHNRFAHVRIPSGVLLGSGGSVPTSMPVLALGSPATILSATTLGSTPQRIAPPASPPGSNAVVTPASLSGFLRPEFVIGSDAIHLDPSAVSWGSQRLGEDVVVNNLIGLDVKIFDPGATSFTTTAGLVVGPGDAAYRGALVEALADTAASASRGEIQGSFVDLMYPVIAGGSLRGWQDRHVDRLSSGASPISDPETYVVTPFSGVVDSTIATATSVNAYANSLYRSGKIVTSGNSIRLFQPTYDTYTSFYERDGIRQARASNTSEGTLWQDGTLTPIDSGSDGLDGAGIYGGGQVEVTGQFGADDVGEHETLPPFTTPAEAVQISVRLYNPSTRQIKQMSVVHRGER